jgi:hypothetical protein
MSQKPNIRKKRFVINSDTIDSKVEIQTLRYDIGEKFMEELKYFATIHKYDERKVFKEAWNQWTNQDSIQMQINEEVERLKNAGYEGDVLDKMFKSARYYFCKKQEKTKEVPRKQYISLCPQFLEQIDIFIMELLKSGSHSPASAYEEFCKHKKELIVSQVNVLINLKTEEIYIKLKKTFKNRFHVMKTTIQKLYQQSTK